VKQRKLVVASTNPGKLRELRAILDKLPLALVSVGELLPSLHIEEPFGTFAENAAHKALTVARATGELALADDSGLEVEALDGRPGVLSSRIAATDPQRIQWLLDQMKDVPDEQRGARFVCVVALATAAGLVGSWEGTVAGRITRKPLGTHGFGYDPVFYYPPFGCTFGQLEPERKNEVSHRSRALRRLCAALPDILRQLEEGPGPDE